MLVKIVTSSEPTYWYSNKINAILNVKRYDEYHYVEHNNSLKLIKKSDCIILNQENSLSQKSYIEQQLRKINLFTKFLKKHAPNFVPDWTTTEPKYYVYFSHEYKCWNIGQLLIEDANQIYMPCSVCQKLINKLHKSELSI